MKSPLYCAVYRTDTGSLFLSLAYEPAEHMQDISNRRRLRWQVLGNFPEINNSFFRKIEIYIAHLKEQSIIPERVTESDVLGYRDDERI